MRPIYESSRDRENQERVARKLEIAWKVKLKATEQLHFADYWVRKGGALVGIIEIKCRLGYYSTSFPTLMISTRKIRNSQEYVAGSDLKFILVPMKVVLLNLNINGKRRTFFLICLLILAATVPSK